VKKLNFKPFWGLSSRHLQILVSAYAPSGRAPPTNRWLVDIGNGDQLSCEVSTPPHWDEKQTIALIHGLSGNHKSSYMIRLSRQFYQKGYKVVRINARGCGSGVGLSKLPSGAGNSQDVLKVLLQLKEMTPHSYIYLMGFSLGGNTILKLAGELGENANALVKTFIAVCPPLELAETAHLIQQPKYGIYHHYYLSRLLKQAKQWIKEPIHTLQEYDEQITAPLWGFKDAQEYYTRCSCIRFLPKIRRETHIILAEDDPFVDLSPLNNITLPECVQVWTSPHGSHLAFLGRTKWQWLDELLLNWVEGNFQKNSI
jgi:predicted alpha/beta-fold hydrolase